MTTEQISSQEETKDSSNLYRGAIEVLKEDKESLTKAWNYAQKEWTYSWNLTNEKF